MRWCFILFAITWTTACGPSPVEMPAPSGRLQAESGAWSSDAWPSHSWAAQLGGRWAIEPIGYYCLQGPGRALPTHVQFEFTSEDSGVYRQVNVQAPFTGDGRAASTEDSFHVWDSTIWLRSRRHEGAAMRILFELKRDTLYYVGRSPFRQSELFRTMKLTRQTPSMD